MTNYSGKYIGRYHILEPLGEGGMAVVYKAFDTRLEREVAVKFIRTGKIVPDQLEQILKRFEREAKALARFDHPNIIVVYDYGEYGKAPYLVMQYQPGGTLRDLTSADQPMNYREALLLIRQLADALTYAHLNQVIHRDIKPGNVLISESGEPKLTDFGIAKVLDSDQHMHLTGTGVGIGTPEYMSPEQGLGKKIDVTTDIYSLGIVLYELVTGRKPYQADTPMAVILKQIHDPLPLPSEIQPDLPVELEKILVKALAKDPQERYADMHSFGKALDRLLQQSYEGDLPYLERVTVKAGLYGEEENDCIEAGVRNEKTDSEIVMSDKAGEMVVESSGYSEADIDFTHMDAVQLHEEQEGLLKPIRFTGIEEVEMIPRRKVPLWIWLAAGAGLLTLAIFMGFDLFGQRELAELSSPTVDLATKTSIPIETTSIQTATVKANTETSTAIATEIPTSTVVPTLGIGSMIRSEKDGMQLIYVPAGEFRMGSTLDEIDQALQTCLEFRNDCELSWFHNEIPDHNVYLDAFWNGSN
ncbi:MAG: serine/threonine protein kinase [Anaerolineaceae bacterium]|nr:serine/threonine protein kinase [Anaerolineaceae bacterium]